ncbi:hypothetical protein BJY01DRAFT_246903 [Aspergillus pseudoustus]|uniref:Uncharacterized protein n=1 Tax=Aspergillus pseudoustus TaxID=1810923 RepID=A0ABR4K4K2_9EURO
MSNIIEKIMMHNLSGAYQDWDMACKPIDKKFQRSFNPDIAIPSIELFEEQTTPPEPEYDDASTSRSHTPLVCAYGVLVGYWHEDFTALGRRPVYISPHDLECVVERSGRIEEVRYEDFDPLDTFDEILGDMSNVLDREEIDDELRPLVESMWRRHFQNLQS